MEFKRKAGIIVRFLLLVFELIYMYLGSIEITLDRKTYEELRPDHIYKNITILYSAEDAKNKTEEYLRDYTMMHGLPGQMLILPYSSPGNSDYASPGILHAL